MGPEKLWAGMLGTSVKLQQIYIFLMHDKLM
uniref:Uncharacterized protein n=1 Tax=Arundo donax TaxID=35708 RepID=A0A0A9AKG7_ARUDO